jgi:hypothetical protein
MLGPTVDAMAHADSSSPPGASPPGASPPGGGAEADDSGPAPIHTFCPRCGADSDAPDRVFEIGDPVLAPRTDFLVSAVHCRTCDLWFDVALWVADARALLGAMGPEGAALEQPAAEGRALRGRYRGLIEASQERWERCYALALFFTPGERPFLSFEPGHAVPLVHCYLPAEFSSLAER